jgi:hypothetical protein
LHVVASQYDVKKLRSSGKSMRGLSWCNELRLFLFFLHRLLTKTNTRSNYCIFTEIIVNKKKMHKFASISKITDPIITKINRFEVLTVQKENFCKFSRTKENFRQAYASRHSKNNFSSRFQLTTIRIDLTVIILFPHGT